MTAYTLRLKSRPVKNVITMDLATAKMLITDKHGKDKLYDTFKELVDNQSSEEHDKQWLELICSWVNPEKGQNIASESLWLPLRVRVAALDDSKKDGTFTLQQRFVDLIFNRLKDPAFTIRGGLSTNFSQFIMDFLDVVDKQFEENLDFDYDPNAKKDSKNKE